jgi:hypothetical protein
MLTYNLRCLLASPRGGVSERLGKYCEASSSSEDGVVSRLLPRGIVLVQYSGENATICRFFGELLHGLFPRRPSDFRVRVGFQIAGFRGLVL